MKSAETAPAADGANGRPCCCACRMAERPRCDVGSTARPPPPLSGVPTAPCTACEGVNESCLAGPGVALPLPPPVSPAVVLARCASAAARSLSSEAASAESGVSVQAALPGGSIGIAPTCAPPPAGGMALTPWPVAGMLRWAAARLGASCCAGGPRPPAGSTFTAPCSCASGGAGPGGDRFGLRSCSCKEVGLRSCSRGSCISCRCTSCCCCRSCWACVALHSRELILARMSSSISDHLPPLPPVVGVHPCAGTCSNGERSVAAIGSRSSSRCGLSSASRPGGSATTFCCCTCSCCCCKAAAPGIPR